MWRGHFLFTFSVTLCFIVLLDFSASAETPVDTSVKNPFAGNAEAIATGKMLFEAACTGYCHATATANRAGRCPNLFDCEWKHGGSDGEVFHSVTEGVPKTEMVGFKGRVPDEMLWKVIAYLRSASQCQNGSAPAAAAH
ncbi:MAG: c-type cytochrome [Deltaproteobacteria bacterium]|nr:c-type cytochrome [Deltaproteobacteria bacterium]